MNLDYECQAAMSRVAYAVNANAEYEKIQIAKEFAKLRVQKKKVDKQSELNAFYARQMAAMQNCDNPYLGQLMYANLGAFGSDPLANFGLRGNYPW